MKQNKIQARSVNNCPNTKQVSVLTHSIRYLSHKAQAQGLSGDERELLKGQLFALEFYIARTSAPHTQPLATTSISDSRPSSPPAADLASGVAADRHWHHLHDTRDHHLGVNLTSQHKKRAKRTFNRACVHCGTQFTSQWRKGPAGASTYVAPLHFISCPQPAAPFDTMA